MKKIRCILPMLVCLLMIGCSRQVITVAGLESQEQTQESANYIEIRKFELKEPKDEYEGEDVAFCAVLIPAGYAESEEIPGMYIHERSPFEASNIYYSVSEGNGEGIISAELTQEQYEKLVEEAYTAKGQSVDLEIKAFEKSEIEGVPSYIIRSSYAKAPKQVQQLTYLILAEDTHIITYTQMSDDEMMADFMVSEGQIKLVIAD